MGDVEYCTYEMWEAGDWPYEKCRMDLKTIALFCEQVTEGRAFPFSIHVLGGTFANKTFKEVMQGHKHMAQVVREGYIGFGPKWHFTDYVSNHDHLLKEPQELSQVYQWFKKYGLEKLLLE